MSDEKKRLKMQKKIIRQMSNHLYDFEENLYYSTYHNYSIYHKQLEKYIAITTNKLLSFTKKWSNFLNN